MKISRLLPLRQPVSNCFPYFLTWKQVPGTRVFLPRNKKSLGSHLYKFMGGKFSLLEALCDLHCEAFGGNLLCHAYVYAYVGCRLCLPMGWKEGTTVLYSSGTTKCIHTESKDSSGLWQRKPYVNSSSTYTLLSPLPERYGGRCIFTWPKSANLTVLLSAIQVMTLAQIFKKRKQIFI